jgi:hypothetical protein
MKGIIDPWRLVTPLQKKPEVPQDPKKRIDLTEIDFDADLCSLERYIFATPHGSILVTGRNITSEDSALLKLAQCLQDISSSNQGQALLLQADIGHTFGDPPPHTRLETKSKPYAAIYFRDQTYEEGMLHLIKLLNTMQRYPKINGKQILNRWGVSTMLK